KLNPYSQNIKLKAKAVGWVEQLETQQKIVKLGFISLNPTYKACRNSTRFSPGRFVFRYFLLATHKFVRSEFEQPKAGPKGESQGWLS
ncbi:hypothetical protein NP590_06665, partial [Methylomonas sp. SURF-2]